MEICSSNNHGEICYEERNCPACERIEDLIEEIEDLQSTIIDLRAQLKEE